MHDMTYRSRRMAAVHVGRQQVAREAKAQARYDLSRLSPQ